MNYHFYEETDIWALARAQDPHSNINQLVASSNNSALSRERLPCRGTAATVAGQVNITTHIAEPQLTKADCKKSGRVPKLHFITSLQQSSCILGAGGESGVHPRSLLLLAGDIETNPGPGREIIARFGLWE